MDYSYYHYLYYYWGWGRCWRCDSRYPLVGCRGQPYTLYDFIYLYATIYPTRQIDLVGPQAKRPMPVWRSGWGLQEAVPGLTSGGSRRERDERQGGRAGDPHTANLRFGVGGLQ